jgi:ketosteroid isomerase-like protein
MNREQRAELVETYFDAMDSESFDRFEEAFTPDVVYRYPGEPDMHGVDAIRTFFEERREHSNSTHEIQRRIDDGTAMVCEGTVTAERPDGSLLEAAFVDVFEFDDDAGGIDSAGVYTRG